MLNRLAAVVGEQTVSVISLYVATLFVVTYDLAMQPLEPRGRSLLETVPISGGEAPEPAESDLAAAGRVLLRLQVDRVYGASHLSEEESR